MTRSKSTGPTRSLVVAAFEEHLSSRRVLIADDCPVSRLITGAALRRHGAVVEEALDGAQAHAMTLERHYDFILMDVQMPICDGLEATRSIRSSGFTGLPIIALSASSSPKEVAASMESGMNHALPKPLSLEKLCGCLAAIKSEPAAAAPGGGEMVSTTLLQDLCGGDDAFAQRLLRIMAQELPAAMKQMQDAFVWGDGEIIARTAHRIRPCFAGLKLGSLHETAMRIEALAKDEAINSELQSLIARLAGGVDQVLNAVGSLRVAA